MASCREWMEKQAIQQRQSLQEDAEKAASLDSNISIRGARVRAGLQGNAPTFAGRSTCSPADHHYANRRDTHATEASAGMTTVREHSKAG